MAAKDKKEKKASSKTGNEDGAYLTKRILKSAAKKGFKEGAKKTTEILGYNMIAEDGWVVKVFANGQKEKISEIKRVKRPSKLVLD